ncbi:DUF2975 domain-containing protein [Maribacter sp. 2307ULW6-5]|uniref:DUF2975 domain-containing protein n=1 Tax=Maribacter sp. 2307ULW6-5 TaxID=3386275 RepID=UPI0039BC6E62
MNKSAHYLRIATFFLLIVPTFKIIFNLKKIVSSLWLNTAQTRTEELSNMDAFVLPMIEVGLHFYLVLILVGVLRTAQEAEKNGLFSPSNIKRFKKFGKALLVFALLSFCFVLMSDWTDPNYPESIVYEGKVQSMSYHLGYTVGRGLSKQTTTIILGLLFFVLAELAEDGHRLKKENDLTI